MAFDVLIRNGLVADGLGGGPVRADVGVEGDRIAAVGDLAGAETAETVDVAGRWVAPGFIDVHNHAHGEAAGGIRNIPEADNMVRMGVTTLIAGNCGGSPWPMGEHLEQVAGLSIRQNYGCLVGHGTIRGRAREGRAGATPAEAIAEMQKLARQAMQEGAFGMSTGYFGPGVTTREIIHVARAVAEGGGVYTSHIRSEAEGLVEAVAEAIQIGEQASIPVQISHLKALGKHAWDKAEQVLSMIDEARERGLNVEADRYPYTRSFTGVAALVPTELREEVARRGGMTHLRDADLEQIVIEGINGEIDALEGPQSALFAPLEPDPELDGKTLGERAEELSVPPHELVIELCIRGKVSCIYTSMREENLKTFLRYPHTMIGSDGHLRTFGEGVSHPRNYGTFPRALGRYAREERCYSMEEGVKRMTSMPAEKFRLRNRGVIREGAYADLVVFDPATIEDRATFENGHQYPVGIEHVIVNGAVAVRDGETTDACAGRVVRPEA